MSVLRSNKVHLTVESLCVYLCVFVCVRVCVGAAAVSLHFVLMRQMELEVGSLTAT